MSDLGNRHHGTAGGQLRASRGATPVAVEVLVPAEVADRSDVQLTAMMLANLLSRSADFVTEVILDVPDVSRAPTVAPTGMALPTVLPDALLSFARRVGADAVPARRGAAGSSSALRLVLESGRAVASGWRVHGNGRRGHDDNACGGRGGGQRFAVRPVHRSIPSLR